MNAAKRILGTNLRVGSRLPYYATSLGKALVAWLPAEERREIWENAEVEAFTGGTFIKVKTSSFKASQYDHKADKCKKKELKERWHLFEDGTKVQRDLYSVFLLMNSDLLGLKTDRACCFNTLKPFFNYHEEVIKKIENKHEVVLNSGIKLKVKKTVGCVA